MIENADPGYDWIFSHKISEVNYKIWRFKLTYGNSRLS